MVECVDSGRIRPFKLVYKDNRRNKMWEERTIGKTFADKRLNNQAVVHCTLYYILLHLQSKHTCQVPLYR